MSLRGCLTGALVLAVACMPARYREEPPPPEVEQAPESAARGAARPTGGTVVGHVAPDGTLVADTLARAVPDTARVERETVVTGEIRPATELETEPPAAAGEVAETLATGWRIQVFASRSEAEAAAEATRARNALGDQAPVYVESDDSWFKVRVGDFSDRGAAERLRARLADLGWIEAWAVRTTIRTAP
ncbi:MAG TPA: SPOR domain-containing protein [Gemmatimonadota bacterium]|nr:SPOR domain-containing protein [Gemmatimonadota bacterium]